MSLLDGTVEDFIDGIFDGLDIPSTPPSIPGTGSSLADELRTPDGVASADRWTEPPTATVATQTETPPTTQAGAQTATDELTRLAELVKQGPQAVDDGPKHLGTAVQTVVRQAAAQLQELRERAQAAGSQEQPRRQTPTPIKPAPTGKHQSMMQQPAPKPPPSQQQVEARNEGWESAADKAQANQLGFDQPAVWQAFKEKHPQAQGVPYRLATTPMQPAHTQPEAAQQPPAQHQTPKWPRTTATHPTRPPPKENSTATPTPPPDRQQTAPTAKKDPPPLPKARPTATQAQPTTTPAAPQPTSTQPTPPDTATGQEQTGSTTEPTGQGDPPPADDSTQIVQWTDDLSYGEDRKLRWRLQRPGAEVPANQHPPPTMRPLACEDMQDLISREEATGEEAPMPYIEGAAYWYSLQAVEGPGTAESPLEHEGPPPGGVVRAPTHQRRVRRPLPTRTGQVPEADLRGLPQPPPVALVQPVPRGAPVAHAGIQPEAASTDATDGQRPSAAKKERRHGRVLS